MAKKLYVGNLSYDTTPETLTQLFSGLGELNSVDVIMDRYSGRSKGFGFVEMADDEAANKAIAELDGREVDGRTIKVAEARPQGERRDRGSSGGFGGRGGGGGRGGFGGRSRGGSDRSRDDYGPRF